MAMNAGFVECDRRSFSHGVVHRDVQEGFLRLHSEVGPNCSLLK